MAVSEDDGASFEKLGAVVSSSQPKGWVYYEGQGDAGAAEPGSVVTSDGAYLYLYYTEHSRIGGRGVQVCLARVPLDDGPLLPGQFEKWHDGAFSTPGLGGLDTPVMTTHAWDDSEAMQAHVVYSAALNKYVMVLSVDFWKEFVEEDGKLERSGIYIALSSDGIAWSRPERLIRNWVIPLLGRPLEWNATFLPDPGSSSEGWLVYGYSERWGHKEAVRQVPGLVASSVHVDPAGSDVRRLEGLAVRRPPPQLEVPRLYHQPPHLVTAIAVVSLVFPVMQRKVDVEGLPHVVGGPTALLVVVDPAAIATGDEGRRKASLSSVYAEGPIAVKNRLVDARVLPMMERLDFRLSRSVHVLEAVLSEVPTLPTPTANRSKVDRVLLGEGVDGCDRSAVYDAAGCCHLHEVALKSLYL
jgi:hypothetical protein